MLRKLKEFASNESGNVVIMTALLSIPLLVVVGAAIDTGRLQKSKRDVQVAADSAVLSSCNQNAILQGAQAQRAHAMFLANLQRTDAVKKIDGDFFAEHLDDDRMLVSFKVIVDIKGMFAGIESLQDRTLVFESMAMCYTLSGRPPVLVDREGLGKVNN